TSQTLKRFPDPCQDLPGREPVQDVIADISDEGTSWHPGSRLQLRPQAALENARQSAKDQKAGSPVGSAMAESGQVLDSRAPRSTSRRDHRLKATSEIARTERNDTTDLIGHRQPSRAHAGTDPRHFSERT